VVGGKMDTEKPMELNFVKEWDESKGQVIEAMKSNANQLTNLIKSQPDLWEYLLKNHLSTNDGSLGPRN
jgi:hypothetical protein